MRFIHTADWHLGRIFHGVHLTADQAHVLDQLVRIVADARPDAVLVAGDVYDRAVPPPEAVELLDDTLSRIVLDLGVPVVLIAGNHDSPRRLAFGARLMRAQRLHLFGAADVAPAPVLIEDTHGVVHVFPFPYAEPAAVRELAGDPAIADHAGALAALVARAGRPRDARAVALAHAFVDGGVSGESERPLALGGAFSVPPDILAEFNYAALGHLHRPQAITGAMAYAGSILKYSFDESGQSKSVAVVEMDRLGRCRAEAVPLQPRRDVRRIAGRFDDLLRDAPAEGRDDYLEVTLQDRGPILDAMGRLREVYPNVLHVARTAGPEPDEGLPGAGRRFRGMDDAALFAAFFRQVTAEELAPEETTAVAEVITAERARQREA